MSKIIKFTKSFFVTFGMVAVLAGLMLFIPVLAAEDESLRVFTDFALSPFFWILGGAFSALAGLLAAFKKDM